MTAAQTFDTIERLFAAAGHPDIAKVDRFGSDMRSVCVTYQDGAEAYLWPVTDRVSTEPVELPADLGDYRFRTSYALRMLVDLLDIAQPAGWAWRTVAVDDVGLRPCGLEVKAGGVVTLLRVTSGGAPGLHSEPAAWADYSYPEEAIKAVSVAR